MSDLILAIIWEKKEEWKVSCLKEIKELPILKRKNLWKMKNEKKREKKRKKERINK